MAPKRRSFADNATGFCSEPECLEPVLYSGLCRGHVRQRERGKRLRPLGAERPTMSPLQRLHEAALKYAEASAENPLEYRRADDNLCKAAIGYSERRSRRERGGG